MTNPILLNPIVEVVVAALIYPGVVVALIAAGILAWVRGTAQQTLAHSGAAGGGLAALRAAWGEEAQLPAGVYEPLLNAGAIAAVIFPLLALILLPVPGNPLTYTLGLGGDLAAEAGLLLGVPLVRLLLGWLVPSPYTRASADRGARLLAGAALPMGLALAATAEQVGSQRLDIAPQGVSLPLISLLARVLAALAFACVLPVLARVMVPQALVKAATAAREAPEAVETDEADETDAAEGAEGEESAEDEDAEPAEDMADEEDEEDAETEPRAVGATPNELELTGRDAVMLRVGEALQLVAVSAFFIAAFVLPLFSQFTAPLVHWLLWIVGLLVVAAGIGLWQGYVASQNRPEKRGRASATHVVAGDARPARARRAGRRCLGRARAVRHPENSPQRTQGRGRRGGQNHRDHRGHRAEKGERAVGSRAGFPLSCCAVPKSGDSSRMWRGECSAGALPALRTRAQVVRSLQVVLADPASDEHGFFAWRVSRAGKMPAVQEARRLTAR